MLKHLYLNKKKKYIYIYIYIYINRNIKNNKSCQTPYSPTPPRIAKKNKYIYEKNTFEHEGEIGRNGTFNKVRKLFKTKQRDYPTERNPKH